MVVTDGRKAFCLTCRVLMVAPVALAIFCASASQNEFWFPPSLIADDEQMVADLAYFEQGGQQPGQYPVELWLNNSPIATRTLSFIPDREKSGKDNTGLMACLTRKDLLELGVKPDVLPNADTNEEPACLAPARFIPQAETRFDFQKMRLEISIPQAALQSRPRGWLPPELWDDGIHAGLLNYHFSGSESRGRQGNSRHHFLRLNSGLNIGPWRLRDDRTWTEIDSHGSRHRRWQHGSAYLERAIIPWRSYLTLGDATTDGEVFDSTGFRGVRIMTDDSMYPDSQRGFAPVIRGSAMSNASVSIRQNGYEVYRINVAPGNFVIDDLFPMYASGDLEVRVTEADGSMQTFTVPYSSVPLLLREGRFKYGVTVGKLRRLSERYEEPSFVQSTLIWGLPHGITTYGGLQYADNYRAGTLGAGMNMGRWGAISADVTHANSTLTDSSQHEGQSVRFLYGRSLNDFGTTFQLTGWRYSTQGFYTLDETALKGMSGWRFDPDKADADGRGVMQPITDYYNLYDNKRQRLQANISQRIGDRGSLYLTGSRQTYWNRRGVSESLQAGFSSSLKGVNYSLSVNQSRTAGLERTDQSLFMALSLPLDRWLPSGKPSVYATASASRDKHGGTLQQAGLSGSLLEQRNLNWNVMQGHSRTGGESGSAALGYQGTYGNANLGYSYSNSTRQNSYGVAGGAVLHRNGLTLSQPLGDTSVLVAAPGAAGILLENGSGMKTDWRGYTIRPFAISYRENRIALDTSKLDDRTEIDNAVSQVVPTRGAIVRADFIARSGLRVLMTLKHKGKPLPFGTLVSTGDNSSIVGDEGQVFLSGLEKKGVIKAKWGADADRQCEAAWQITDEAARDALVQYEAECR
ncbi:fimbrial biogenesis usher protein [Erwinia sp. 198]|uniref:fimbrial biogenesis usher protein n=1 Tax=Erwinia sp. 198 TaxID=2022746 RepID=UPI001F413135|nr:fimbrial biogenesis usher protein [Erwinia sp. 198]